MEIYYEMYGSWHDVAVAWNCGGTAVGTKIWIECSNEIFTATGKTIIQSGWKDIYKTNKINESDKDKVLPEVCQGETLKFIKGEVKDKVTIPPKRFTASTLLAAMKEISKYVKNPDLKMKLKSVSGIGTEATRATIIDELTKADKTSKQSFLKFDKKF
jgi:DNA topoisomerase III